MKTDRRTKKKHRERKAEFRKRMIDRGYIITTYKLPEHMKHDFDCLVKFAITPHEGELLLDMEFQRMGKLCGIPDATTH